MGGMYSRKVKRRLGIIFTIEVVPYIFKEIVQRLEEDYYNAKEINNKQEREIKRTGILKQINDYKVPIPLYWWLSQNKSKFEYYSRLGIKILGKNLNMTLTEPSMNASKHLQVPSFIQHVKDHVQVEPHVPKEFIER